MTRPACWRAALGVALALTASGCLGSPNPRNPNLQRRDTEKLPPKRRKSLINSAANSRVEPTTTERLLQSLPQNSWKQHDQDVHRVLPESEADGVAKTYPWFNAGGAADPDEG